MPPLPPSLPPPPHLPGTAAARTARTSRKKQKDTWAADSSAPLPGLDPLLGGGASAMPTPIREHGYGGDEDEGNRAERRAAAKEKERRRKAKDMEDEGEEPPSKGVSWTGIFLMTVMFGPAVFPVLMTISDYLSGTPVGDAMNVVLLPLGEIAGGGLVAFGLSQSYQQQVEAHYMAHMPEKIGRVTGLLKKHEGKEEQLIVYLEKKAIWKSKKKAAQKKKKEKAARKAKEAADFDLEDGEEDD